MFNGSKTTYITVLFLLLTSLISFSASSQLATTPSAAQLEQFKSLPKSQQEALAKQFGVDISVINGMSGNARASEFNTERPEQRYLKENQLDGFNSTAEFGYEEESDELKPFGYEMFEQLQDAFLPKGSIPVPSDYIVGPGDELQISLFGKESSEHFVLVNNDGKVLIPGLEPITVGGLSFSELKSYIANVVETKMIGIKSAVTLANLRGVQVYVVGDVKKPGAYYLSSLSTITNALFISGGPSEVGSLRDIQLRRGGKTIAQLDLYQLFTNGDVSQDARLQQGDVVFINAIDKQVSINGEVRRPAIYEVLGNETVADLVDMAGGLNLNAYPKYAVLARFNENYQRDVQRINLNDQAITKQKLANGDVLTVLPISERFDQVVNIAGAVSRPSTYAWSEGISLSDLIVNSDDLMETTDLNYGLILSKSRNGEYKVRQFKPGQVVNGQKEKLTAGDLVVFLSRYDEETFLKSNKDEDSKNKHGFTPPNFQSNTSKVNPNNQGQNYQFAQSNQHQPNSQYQPNQQLQLNETNQAGALVNQQAGLGNFGWLNELKEFNYLHAIQNGTLFEKQKALLATKSLSRKELISPIIKLLSNSTSAGKMIPVVSLTGQVRFPGDYPVSDDASLVDIILAGGGLKESANLVKGEISRVITDENAFSNVRHIDFDLMSAMTGNKEHNIKIQPKDVVNVFQQANWNESLKVKISGEVKYPGEYTVNEGETLADVLKRAGGVTELASVESAFFTRESLRELERKQARDMARSLSKELALKSISSSMSSINIAEVQTLVSQLTTIEGVGRLVIDLPKLMEDKTYDLVLENGDELVVPSFKNQVNVVGEVQVATSHFHNDKWDMYDYIKSSGGLRQQSDDDRIYIVRSNGLVDAPDTGWFTSSDELKINPGDTIVVPLDADYTDKLTLWEKATSIFYNSAVALAAIGRL